MFSRVRTSLRNCSLNLKLMSTKSKEVELREARRLRSVGMKASPPTVNKSILWRYKYVITGTTGSICVIAYCIQDIRQNSEGSLAQFYRKTPLHDAVIWFQKTQLGFLNNIYQPSKKLLPDFISGPVYGDIPPGAQPPPLLILDLERTLIGSIYDSKHGWRHVKRPGTDTFLTQLRQYYEIVIFSENDKGLTMDVMDSVGGDFVHKFGSSEAEIRNGITLKRLDCMNRDIKRIVLIDDDPRSTQLFPRNSLLIKPYTDVHDKSDRALLELIPLLQAFVHEGVDDIRDAIDKLGTHDAHEAATEYKMRVVNKKTNEHLRRNYGLGGLIRAKPQTSPMETEDFTLAGVVTAQQLVGPAPVASASPLNSQPAKPPVEKKKGKFFEWLEEVESKKLAEEQAKLEKMHEVQLKKLRDKEERDKLEQLLEEDRQRTLEKAQKQTY